MISRSSPVTFEHEALRLNLAKEPGGMVAPRIEAIG